MGAAVLGDLDPESSRPSVPNLDGVALMPCLGVPPGGAVDAGLGLDVGRHEPQETGRRLKARQAQP